MQAGSTVVKLIAPLMSMSGPVGLFATLPPVVRRLQQVLLWKLKLLLLESSCSKLEEMSRAETEQAASSCLPWQLSPPRRVYCLEGGEPSGPGGTAQRRAL